jgi:hypothetical protein
VHRGGEGGGEVKLTTKEKDDLAVRKYKEGRKDFVELQVETDIGGALVFLTPKEAERLGNALIKAAQPKQKREGK